MIVLVGGLPGSGKTYFAKKLAGEIDAILFSSDKVRKSLRASGRYNIEDKLHVYKEFVTLAESELINSKNRVVIDATFSHQSMRFLFTELATRLSVPLYFIWICANEEVIRKRTQMPREDSEADFEVYKKIRDRFEPITIPCLMLESTDNNIEIMLKKAEDYIFDERK